MIKYSSFTAISPIRRKHTFFIGIVQIRDTYPYRQHRRKIFNVIIVLWKKNSALTVFSIFFNIYPWFLHSLHNRAKFMSYSFQYIGVNNVNLNTNEVICFDILTELREMLLLWHVEDTLWLHADLSLRLFKNKYYLRWYSLQKWCVIHYSLFVEEFLSHFVKKVISSYFD